MVPISTRHSPPERGRMSTRALLMAALIYPLVFPGGAAAQVAGAARGPALGGPPLEVPASLRKEHEELHARMREARGAGGESGAAAERLAARLGPHFEKENAYALPPLSLLPALARGEYAPEMEQALPLTDRIREHLDEHLAEHLQIAAAAEELRAAALREGKPEVAHLAETIKLHAQTEEEVLYPTSILIGEYLRMKRRRQD